MRVSLLNFVGVRKHFFTEALYNISLYEENIEMTDIKSKVPKYVLPLTLTTVIEITGSVFKAQRNFTGFIFRYKDGTKLMNCKSHDLILFIELLSNKITFMNITFFYQAIGIVGRGSSSSVSVVMDNYSLEQFAVKSIDKHYLQSNDKKMILFSNEVKILQLLANHNSQKYYVHLYRVFESQTSYYLVLNLMKGKSLTELYNKIRKKSDLKQFAIDSIRIIMRRLLLGVQQLHALRIIHRDLKPDNLLFAETNNYESMVIADFGLATSIDVEDYQYPICGTQGFMAPEITHFKEGCTKYNEKIDIYSIGVIFNWLQVPLLNRLTGDINVYSSKKIDQISLNLLHNLLKVDPKERISAESALEHPFFLSDEITKKTLRSSQFGFVNFINIQENVDCDTIVQKSDLKQYTMPPIKKQMDFS